MRKLFRDIESLGGLASYRELRDLDHERWMIELPVLYGSLIRVRTGWFAAADESDDVVRAWRVGGRLTCVSALAWHEDVPLSPTLHVEVPANAARLRSPVDYRRALGAHDDVVTHWARRLAQGDRRAVGVHGAWAEASRCVPAARAMAESCGLRLGRAQRGAEWRTLVPQAASSESASRIV